MATVTRQIDAAPEQVFAVLADPLTYDRWVVGTRQIRGADPAWPEPGARLYHSVGIGPLNLKDDCKVLAVDSPRELVLEARGRPLGTARIEFRIQAEGNGSRVTIDELIARPLPLALLNPVLWFAIRVRNTETLRRMAQVVDEVA